MLGRCSRTKKLVVAESERLRIYTCHGIFSTREVRTRKMSVETNNRSDEKVWTRGRIMSVAARLAVILPLAIVSYHIGGLVPVAAATTPKPVEWRSSDSRPRIRRRRLKKSANSFKTFKLITGLAGLLSKLLRL